MASSATTSIRIEKPASGDKSGTWATTANTNYDIIDAATNGSQTITTTSGTYDLSAVDADYTADAGKNALLYVTSNLVGNLIIQVTNRKRYYRVYNNSTGSYTVSLKTSGGSAVAITQGSVATLWCDGSNVITFATPMTVPGTGAPTSGSGAVASAVSVTPSGNLSSTNAQSALVELQGDIDTINAALPGYQPLDTDLTAIAALSNAKGTIIAGNGTAWAALSVGTNGLVLRANSSATTGNEWGAGAPASTVQTWMQTAAPTGWTKQTDSATYDGRAIRVVTGTASSGGSTAFTSVFTSRTISQANLPNVNLSAASLTATSVVSPTGSLSSSGSSAARIDNGTNAVVNAAAIFTVTTTIGGNVPLGGSGTAMDFAVKYLDVIVATAA